MRRGHFGTAIKVTGGPGTSRPEAGSLCFPPTRACASGLRPVWLSSAVSLFGLTLADLEWRRRDHPDDTVLLDGQPVSDPIAADEDLGVVVFRDATGRRHARSGLVEILAPVWLELEDADDFHALA